MFYLGRNDGFCKETLECNNPVSFMWVFFLYSKTIKVQLNICLLRDA